MKTILPLAVMVLAAIASLASANERWSAAPLVAWNEQVLAAAEAQDGFMTLKGLRTATMLHLAVHDALASIDGRYMAYAYHATREDADPITAAVQAAYVIASEQYGDQQATWTQLRDQWLPSDTDTAAHQNGLALGNAAARAVLKRRQNDGWNTEAQYQWHPMGPGVYAEFSEHSNTPQGFVFGSGWARARPFALEKPDQFRSPAPPEISSKAYAQAFNEVKAVGRFQSMARTTDQTHLALWWKDFAENSHNRLARDLINKEGLELFTAARLFALLNMGIYDAYISVFDNKFYYNHWRPYTAIRWAANDGNPQTGPEETWTNLHRHTYAFPSYPSAHGTACAAAMSAIADTFGERYAFVMRTPEVDIAGPLSGKISLQPPVRSFKGPISAARECALSRVYLGIHFRYDSIAGFELGKQIGAHISSNVLQRRPKAD